MSVARLKRGGWRWSLAAAPLICLAVALAALLWVRFGAGVLAGDADAADESLSLEESVPDSEGYAELLGEEAAEQVDQILGTTASSSSSDGFLDDLAEQAESEGASCVAVAWESDADIVDSATAVLEAYQALGTATLATSGYLDLKGNAWGAVVQDSRGWVDIVVAAAAGDGTASEVRVVRLLPAAG